MAYIVSTLLKENMLFVQIERKVECPFKRVILQ